MIRHTMKAMIVKLISVFTNAPQRIATSVTVPSAAVVVPRTIFRSAKFTPPSR